MNYSAAGSDIRGSVDTLSIESQLGRLTIQTACDDVHQATNLVEGSLEKQFHNVIGQRVSRKFSVRVYEGVVESYDNASEMFKVAYTNGYWERMRLEELMKYLVPHEQPVHPNFTVPPNKNIGTSEGFGSFTRQRQSEGFISFTRQRRSRKPTHTRRLSSLIQENVSGDNVCPPRQTAQINEGADKIHPEGQAPQINGGADNVHPEGRAAQVNGGADNVRLGQAAQVNEGANNIRPARQAAQLDEGDVRPARQAVNLNKGAGNISQPRRAVQVNESADYICPPRPTSTRRIQHSIMPGQLQVNEGADSMCQPRPAAPVNEGADDVCPPRQAGTKRFKRSTNSAKMEIQNSVRKDESPGTMKSRRSAQRIRPSGAPKAGQLVRFDETLEKMEFQQSCRQIVETPMTLELRRSTRKRKLLTYNLCEESPDEDEHEYEDDEPNYPLPPIIQIPWAYKVEDDLVQVPTKGGRAPQARRKGRRSKGQWPSLRINATTYPSNGDKAAADES